MKISILAMKLPPFNLVAYSESKEQRGENSDFLFLGQTIRADILGRIYLCSQKSSQMAAYVCKSENEEYSVDIDNLFSNSIQLACLT